MENSTGLSTDHNTSSSSLAGERSSNVDSASLSSSSSMSNILFAEDQMRCWSHFKKILDNATTQFNEQSDKHEIDATLPIVICSFSKGCIVINELCHELTFLNKADNVELFDNETGRGLFRELCQFKARVRHLIWLDGGHCGTSNAWIVCKEVVETIKRENYSCYVYVTPYQMMSSKKWAVEEYKRFVRLMLDANVNMRNEYLFQDKEEDYDIDVHFDILREFEIDFLL